MSEPLTWDSGIRFDSGLTWDGVVPETTHRKTMSNTKVIVDFTDYPAPDLAPVARHIENQMTANAATFTAPTITMVALGTLIDTYETRLTARASKATADILAFNETRDELEAALADLGHYVNYVAKGDAMDCEKSGFPVYTTGSAPDPTPPAAPTNLRLKHAGVTGSVIGRYRPARTPSTNEVQTTTGDPNVEASWSQYGLFQGGKAVLSGFTPGVLLWVRVRTVGLAGVMGAWSDPAQIRVL